MVPQALVMVVAAGLHPIWRGPRRRRDEAQLCQLKRALMGAFGLSDACTAIVAPVSPDHDVRCDNVATASALRLVR
jgi:hypothetical protein